MFHWIYTRPHFWLRSRSWREIWPALPALAAGLAALALLLTHAIHQAGWNNPAHYYKTMAINALAATNYDFARIACLRGMVFGGGEKTRSEWLYYLSRALDGQGHHKEAADTLNAAAPLNHIGSGIAHLAAARGCLNATNPTPDTISLAEHHLQVALLSEPQSVEVNETLGRLYINTGDWDKADKYLKQALPAKSELALLLAVVAHGKGDIYNANNWANVAVQTFTRNLKRDAPRENPEDRVGWAQALVLQKEFAGALAVLQQGYYQSGNPAYRRPLADVCAAWAGERNGANALPTAEQLRVINIGLECLPQHAALLKLLIEMGHLTGAEGDHARAALNRMLAQGEPPALLHFLLGNDAWQQGKLKEARIQMELAFQAAPQMPYVANNLAMLLCVSSPPELARALAIVQSVVISAPANPEFRDTRGKILLKLGRFQEAVTDLEFSLPSRKSVPASHQALAEAYDSLGLGQLAKEHRLLALSANPSSGARPAPGK